MHQPFYKDLAQGQYVMPWARLHALKDYYGMVAILREFPTVHMTFNLVPSLLVQLEDYARDEAIEPAMDAAFRPLGQMTPADQSLLLETAFQINRENLLFRYPRFKEIEERARAAGSEAAVQLFTAQDWLDLQVLSQLAWFDEIYLSEDPEISRLVAKSRGYSEEDKVTVRRKEIELIKVTLEEYRAASERGQIEISTSPFYHPILPLVCDTAIARESHPGVPLPRKVFRHPEDAREQLRSARDLHERLFSRPPRGLWPSEGSVSDEALRIASEEGFEWAATDEGVLGRSLGILFSRQADGTVAQGQELYRPYQLDLGERSISLFFRDHQISDLIGFVYSRMDAEAAAADLHGRIKAAARTVTSGAPLVSLILDGENAWEFFPRGGREFLKSFYGRVAQDPEIEAVTATEALAVASPGRLSHVVPGSWIDANFDVWIGAEEDNRAWDALSEARDFYERKSHEAGTDPKKIEIARQEIGIAEGSDWCWWYGPEHSSALDEAFDLLYRKQLSNVYHVLGASPPDDLATPIKQPVSRAIKSSPSAPINPAIDGEVTTYFEWIGAGIYQPEERQGSMHGGQQFIEAIYYGFNDQSLFLRLDFHEGFSAALPAFDLRISLNGESPIRIQASFLGGRLAKTQLWRREAPVDARTIAADSLQIAMGGIFEMRLDFSLAGLHPEEQTRMQISVWENGLPLETVPREGWLVFELTSEPASW